MREEFVKRVLAHEKSKSALCREYGISRPTGDKWIERYLRGEAMDDQSHAPHNVTGKISADIETEIVMYRSKYPAIGSTKLREIMKDDGYTGLPCARTFNNVFQRNGLITPEASQAATPIIRFQRDEPNQLFQCDFKGHFPMLNGQECHPLNIIDDHSKYLLGSHALHGETYDEVKGVMTETFQEYGLPEELLCDNGTPWGTATKRSYTRFEVWLMELNVLTKHCRAYHPWTQGKIERLNGSMKRECLKGREFRDMEEVQRALDEYRVFYNERRPHHALKLDKPAQHYTPSPRRFPEQIEEWDYGDGLIKKRVDKDGYFKYDGGRYFLSEGLAKKWIALRESHVEGEMTLIFRNFRIGRIDPLQKKLTSKTSSRLPNV